MNKLYDISEPLLIKAPIRSASSSAPKGKLLFTGKSSSNIAIKNRVSSLALESRNLQLVEETPAHLEIKEKIDYTVRRHRFDSGVAQNNVHPRFRKQYLQHEEEVARKKN